MARKSATSCNAIASLKTGDIIWVPYRKSPKWPAVVKNVYPKKITYFFLPEPQSGRPPTFKTTPKSASLFKETDTLPTNANKDLQEAYKAALAIKRGDIQLRCVTITSNNRRNSEAEPPSPSTSTTSSLVDVPVKKPRQIASTEGQEFIEYTVILVDTKEKPNWPALLLKVDDAENSVRRFPLTENKESERFPTTFCHNVTYEGIEKLIVSNDRKKPDFVRALVAAQEFIENPQNYYDFPPGFDFPQKPTPAPRNDQPLSKNDVDMTEEKDVKNVSKFSQNGLTLSNLSLSSSKNDIFKAMLSYEAREHVGTIFAGQYKCKRNSEYHRAERASDASFSFFCGDLLNFAELEIVVAELHNWIALSPKLPKMSLLGEMHYISKVVLPEVCVFAIARINQVSTAEAELSYQKAIRNNNSNGPSPSSSKRQSLRTASETTQLPSVSKAGTSFEQLLRAVSIERAK